MYSDENLASAAFALYKDYEDNSNKKDTYYQTTNRNVVYWEYHQGRSKNFIDSIDKIVATHFELSDEQLDFIINFDIKYRLGDELNSEE